MTPPDRSPPEQHLDDLLAAWGQRHALTTTRAEQIRHAIVGSQPVGLNTTWWTALSAQVTATVVQAGGHADRIALAMAMPSHSAATAG